jgi:hypothetical protein
MDTSLPLVDDMSSTKMSNLYLRGVPKLVKKRGWIVIEFSVVVTEELHG